MRGPSAVRRSSSRRDLGRERGVGERSERGVAECRAGRHGGRRRGAPPRSGPPVGAGRTPRTATPAVGGDPDGGDDGEPPGVERPFLAGGDDGKQALGQLARPVGSDLRARVAERRVGEPPQCLVGEGRRLQRGREARPPRACRRRGAARTGRWRDRSRRRRWCRDRPAGRRRPAAECGPLRSQSLRRSKGATSSTSSHADVGQRGQPVHRPDDPGAVSLRARRRPGRASPSRSAMSSRSRSVGAGTIRSTTELGKQNLARRSTPPGEGSMRSAASRTRARSTLPLSRRLSSDAKTGGASPARRRRARARAIEGGRGRAGAPRPAGPRCSFVALLGDGQRHELGGRRRHRVERSGRPRSPRRPAHRSPAATMSSPGSRTATVKSPSCGASWSCARRLLMETPLISAGWPRRSKSSA